jgi:mono/diheme cytochrome c family protein
LVPFELEDDELLARIREGGGEMPSISSQRVTDAEVKQIAAYLRSLSAAGGPGPAGLASCRISRALRTFRSPYQG